MANYEMAVRYSLVALISRSHSWTPASTAEALDMSRDVYCQCCSRGRGSVAVSAGDVCGDLCHVALLPYFWAAAAKMKTLQELTVGYQTLNYTICNHISY